VEVKLESEQIWHVKNEVRRTVKKSACKSGSPNNNHRSQFASLFGISQSNVFINYAFSDEEHNARPCRKPNAKLDAHFSIDVGFTEKFPTSFF
jgi:hypothetical protein